MGVKDRGETSRTAYECRTGYFVFYTCQAERWLYVDNPIEKWFETHIFCGVFVDRFQKYQPNNFSNLQES
jgi:hypothetical protein